MHISRTSVTVTLLLALFVGGCSTSNRMELLGPRHADARKEVEDILKDAKYNKDVIRYIRKYIVPLPSGQGALVELAHLAGNADRNCPELKLVAEYMIIEEASFQCEMANLATKLVEAKSNNSEQLVIDKIKRLRASTTYPTVSEAIKARKATM